MHVGSREFSSPVPPSQWTAKIPDAIWPALMMCDLIPLVSNQSGDYLCGRVGADNRIAEIVYWFHGGGDWIPWGKSLPEALIFDALRSRLPGPHHRHAEPAEAQTYQDSFDNDPLIQWACRHVHEEIQTILEQPHDYSGQAIADAMLRHDVGSSAVQLELIEATLFPNAVEANQDAAEQLALDAIRLRCPGSEPLAWAWNVAADAAAKRGDAPVAVDRFGNAMLASNFSDQSVRLRHSWDASSGAKYAVDRLNQLLTQSSADSAGTSTTTSTGLRSRLNPEQKELLMLYTQTVGTRNQAVTDYWMHRSSTLEQSGDYRAAHQCMIRAGWDLGAAPMNAYEMLIGEVARLAELAGQSARSAVARTHLACFQDRYGKG